MAFPAGKRRGYWVAYSQAQMNAIGADENLRVGDICDLFGVQYHWTGAAWVPEGGSGAGSIYINIQDHGAVPGGARGTNSDAVDSALAEAAAATSFATVFGPTGQYDMDREHEIPSGVRVLGEVGTIFNFSGATGTFTHGGGFWSQGSAEELSDVLDSDADAGDKSLVFDGIPSEVESGDLLVIYDPTDSSWDDHSVHQRAGEFVEVAYQSGFAVALFDGLIDSYSSGGAVEVHQVSPTQATLENLTIIGRSSGGDAALSVDFGHRWKLRNVTVESTGGMGILFTRSAHCELDRCHVRLYDADDQYAVYLQHCQDIDVECDLDVDSASAACLRAAYSSTEQTGAVPSRRINLRGGRYRHSSFGYAVSFALHTDLCTIANLNTEGGLLLDGGRHTVSDTKIRGNRCIEAKLLHFAAMTLRDVECVQVDGASNRAIEIMLQNDNDVPSEHAQFMLDNVSVHVKNANSGGALFVLLDGDVGPRRIALHDVSVYGDPSTATGVSLVSGSNYGDGQNVALEEVDVSGGSLFECGWNSALDCPIVAIRGCLSQEASGAAFQFGAPQTNIASTHIAVVQGNTVQDCAENVVKFSGYDNAIAQLRVANNVVQDWGSGTDEEKCPVWVEDADAVTIRGNTFGGGPGTDFPVFHMDNVAHLDYGGNSYPEIGNSDILAPTEMSVTKFTGQSWATTEALEGFSQDDRYVAWGITTLSESEDRKADKISFDRPVFLRMLQLKADEAMSNVSCEVFFDAEGTPEYSGANDSSLSAYETYEVQPMLFVPQDTEVSVRWNKDSGGSADAYATVTWMEV